MRRLSLTFFLWMLTLGTALFGVAEPSYGQSGEKIARGAELWSTTCNRCHNLRSPAERTGDQWDVIVSHMRTRANLTKSEVEAIVAYLRRATGEEVNPSGNKGTGRTDPQSADTSATARHRK